MSVRTLAERVTWAVETSTHTTDRAFAAAAGVAPSYLGYLMKGLRGKRMGDDVAQRIARTRGINWHWLKTGEGAPDAPEPTHEPADEVRDVMDEVLIALGPNLDDAERRLARARAKAQKGRALTWDDCLALVQEVRRDVRRARAQVPPGEQEPTTPEDDLLRLHAISEHLRRRLDEGATLEQGLAELGGKPLAELVPASLLKGTIEPGRPTSSEKERGGAKPPVPPNGRAVAQSEPSAPHRGPRGPKGGARAR